MGVVCVGHGGGHAAVGYERVELRNRCDDVRCRCLDKVVGSISSMERLVVWEVRISSELDLRYR